MVRVEAAGVRADHLVVADQELEIFGTDDTNTVEIPTGANTLLNGPVTLRSMDCIRLKWNATGSVWREVSRSN